MAESKVDYIDVCVLLPTLNEANTITEVISGFQDEGFDNILVIDGGSTDGTQELAEEAGATVRTQSGSGKGQAFRESIQEISEPYILMADADGTYRPEDAGEMLEPLANGADHVIGRRNYTSVDAMPVLNHIGNRVMNWLFRSLHHQGYDDILSGYRAFDRETLEEFHLSSDGFRIETELAVEAVRHDVVTEIVDIDYDPRPDDSESNLHPITDGGSILTAIYSLTLRTNPLLFFGVGAAISWLVGGVLSVYILVEWLTTTVGHEALAVVASFCFLFGTQLLMFGFLSQQLNRVADELRSDL